MNNDCSSLNKLFKREDIGSLKKNAMIRIKPNEKFDTKQKIIENLKPLGKTKIIFFVTHDLNDAEMLCKKSIII